VSDNLLAVERTTAPRQTAEERRDQVLEAAADLFAEKGLYGTSTDEIARRVGISQPYLFRLFRTKKELFTATVERCFEETLEMFRHESAGLRGEKALKAIGTAYREAIVADPARLRAQLQAYAASDDPAIRDVVRRGYGRLVEYVEEVSGLGPERVSRFFASGMLLNVIAAMHLLDSKEGWAKRLIEGCK
jgi:AcrR family transcriptional regulator